MYIDTHAHIIPSFYHNSEEIIDKCKSEIAKIVNIGTNIKEAEEVIQLNKKYPNLLFTGIGIHPEFAYTNNIEKIKDDLEKLESLISNNREEVIAIGEMGLDYYFLSKYSDKEQLEIKTKQKFLLKEEIKLSKKYSLPLIIHCREALSDFLEIIKEEYDIQKVKGVLHSCDGELKEINELISYGFFTSFNGIATFKSAENINNLIENIDIKNMVLETDSPFLSPTPLRGTINSPLNIKIIYEYISKRKNIPIKNLKEIVKENVFSLFGI